MEECHSAYWELVPTIDHIIPIAIGGEDNPSNYATTSMLHNSVKSNWTIEQLNWKLYPAGDINEYDGLTGLFVRLTENVLVGMEEAHQSPHPLLRTYLIKETANIFLEVLDHGKSGCWYGWLYRMKP